MYSGDNNEELFKNETKCTQKEYEKFLKIQEKEHQVSELLYTLFNFGFFSMCLVIAFINKEYKLSIIILIGLLIYGWYKFIRPMQKIKKEKNSPKLKNEYINTYKFYKHYFTTENNDGKAQTYYVKIYKVIETETHFYIYISKEYAFIVSKEGFIEANYEDFRKFIKQKVKINYKEKK